MRENEKKLFEVQQHRRNFSDNKLLTFSDMRVDKIINMAKRNCTVIEDRRIIKNK